MPIGQVQVNRLNLGQGQFPEIERYFLFIGQGSGTNEDVIVTADNSTDLDVLLGASDSALKAQVTAARLNAGQNWRAAILPLATVHAWDTGFDYAMTQTSCEGVVITDAIDTSTQLETLQSMAVSALSTYMRPVFFIATTKPIDGTIVTGQSWSEYVVALNAITENIAAENVLIVPNLWGEEQGALAGRLCNRAVTVADSPMRVATGPLLGNFSTLPVDNDGFELDMSVIASLEAMRYSLPQWYPNFPGVYFTDANTLDKPTGDYKVLEYLRVVQKAMRRVYPLAVQRIADRKLNSTPASIAANKNYFLRALLDMSYSREVFGTVFPGEIHPPTDDAIEIFWQSKTEVELYITVKPYNSPKKITVNIALDLSL